MNFRFRFPRHYGSRYAFWNCPSLMTQSVIRDSCLFASLGTFFSLILPAFFAFFWDVGVTKYCQNSFLDNFQRKIKSLEDPCIHTHRVGHHQWTFSHRISAMLFWYTIQIWNIVKTNVPNWEMPSMEEVTTSAYAQDTRQSDIISGSFRYEDQVH